MQLQSSCNTFRLYFMSFFSVDLHQKYHLIWTQSVFCKMAYYLEAVLRHVLRWQISSGTRVFSDDRSYAKHVLPCTTCHEDAPLWHKTCLKTGFTKCILQNDMTIHEHELYTNTSKKYTRLSAEMTWDMSWKKHVLIRCRSDYIIVYDCALLQQSFQTIQVAHRAKARSSWSQFNTLHHEMCSV